MLEAIIALLETELPKEILDIGSGVGNVDMLILDNTPASRIDCVEFSPDMARASVSSLSRYMDRAKVIMKDVMDFNPGQKYDAVLSNLVLRNEA